MDEYSVGVLTNIGLFSFLALSAYLLLIAGEMSFGQQAFFGVGAYTGGVLTAIYGVPCRSPRLRRWPSGALVAVLIGLPTLRLRGLYFAMATLAAAEMARILFELLHFSTKSAESSSGRTARRAFAASAGCSSAASSRSSTWRSSMACSSSCSVLFVRIERSHLGATLRSVGADPELAASLGVNVDRLKLGVAAAAGALPRSAACCSRITTRTSSRATSTSCSACTASRMR
jgi:branched-chain amino acid transport system permease protein